LLLTVKESAIDVPQNIEACRRITFFANSLFMNMPKAPKVQDMLSFRLVIAISYTPHHTSSSSLKREQMQWVDASSLSFYFHFLISDILFR